MLRNIKKEPWTWIDYLSRHERDGAFSTHGEMKYANKILVWKNWREETTWEIYTEVE